MAIAYLSSNDAPASSNSCLSLPASSRSMPSLTGLGASSTSALATFRPRPVAARTTLMTWIFLSPDPVRTTSTVLGSSSSALAPEGGGGAGESEEDEEPSTVGVVLTGSGDKKIQVIKVVRAATGLGLKEAKALVDEAPKPVKEGIDREEADKLKQELEEAGGSVELK